MHNSTLLIHIQLLRPEQVEEFRDYISNPFFNKSSNREEVKNLGLHILNFFPDMEHKALEKKHCFGLLYPEHTQFDLNRFKKVMSELNNLIRDYLLWANYNSPEKTFSRNLDWTEMMRKNGSDERKYELALEKLKKDHQQELESPEKYLHRYFLEREEMEWRNLHNKAKDDINLVNTLDSLVTHFAAQGTSLINNITIQQKVAPFELPEKLKKITNEAALLVSEKSLSVQTDLIINQILSEEEYHTYQLYNLFDHIQKNEAKFAPDILKDYYTYLRNVCNLIGSQRVDNDVLELLHSIYIDNTAKGYFHSNNRIYPHTFLTVVRNAIHAGEFEWIDKFIHENKYKILDDTDDLDYYRVILSEYLFSLNKFEDAFDILPQNNLKNTSFLIIAKIIEIKICYEIKQDLLDFKLDAFKMYVSRNAKKNISSNDERLSKNFIKHLTKIISLKYKKDQDVLQKLKDKLDGIQKDSYESIWLHRKVNEL